MPMFSYALKSLRANLTRFVATSVAIVIGIGFLAAGLMVTDAVRVGLTGNVEQQYRDVDLAVVASAEDPVAALLQGVPAELLRTVRAHDGVAAAAGELQATVRLKKPDGTAADLRTVGRNWIADDQLNPLSIIEGSAPTKPDEIAIDRELADKAKAKVGAVVDVETPAGPQKLTVTGISAFGSQNAIDEGGTVSFSEESAIQILNTGTPRLGNILIRASGDVDSLRTSLDSVLPSSVAIESHDQFVETATESMVDFLSILRPVLQGFAYLAMFVAGFVIFNTFSVVVTQRFRELALIRAIGGAPKQIRRSLITEGLGIGLVASIVGIIIGAGLAKLLQWALGQFELSLPGSGVRITFGTILLCLVVGTGVTLVAVTIPAFKAGRTRPVEAMRASAVDTSGTSKIRAAIGGTVLAIGLILLAINQLTTVHWYYIGPGAFLLFIGLFIGGPLLARLFATVFRPIMKTLGLTGRIAADNVVRNPKRTATTANALVIGLFLVTLVTVSGEAMKASVVKELNRLSSSDFIVASEGAVAPRLIERIRDVEGVTNIAPVRSAMVTLEDGTMTYMSSADLGNLSDTAGLSVVKGDAASVMEGRGVAVPDFSSLGGDPQASGFGGIGDTLRVPAIDGTTVQLEVTALLEARIDSFLLGYVVSPATFESIIGPKPVTQVFVRVEPGSADEVGPRLDKALDGYTGVEVLPGNFIGEIVGNVFDFLIGAVNALLAMSVIVALVGIVNTMTLAIFERRRELGLVRALGMTRRQVGTMVRLEAVLMGIMGTTIGMSAGVFLSWVLISSIGEGEIELSFNWARVGLIFAVGVLVGVLASIIPSRRATRIDMLDAIRDE